MSARRGRRGGHGANESGEKQFEKSLRDELREKENSLRKWFRKESQKRRLKHAESTIEYRGRLQHDINYFDYRENVQPE